MTGLIEARSGVQFGTNAPTCTATSAGLTRFNAQTSAVEYCNGTDYVAVGLRSPARLRTCRDVKLANAAATTGVYTLVADGTAFLAFCDMTFVGAGNAPGLTLIQSHNVATTTREAGFVDLASASYLPGSLVRSLASASPRVIIRKRGQTDVLYTSDNTIMNRLRSGQILNGAQATPRVGWAAAGGATLVSLDIFCPPVSTAYPTLYHACGNGVGMHLATTVPNIIDHTFSNGTDMDLDVYLGE